MTRFGVKLGGNELKLHGKRVVLLLLSENSGSSNAYFWVVSECVAGVP